MLKSGNSRSLFYCVFVALYLLPIFFFSIAGSQTLLPLVWAAITGGIGLWIFSILLRSWEGQTAVPEPVVADGDGQERFFALEEELQQRGAHCSAVEQELARTREALEVAIQEKEAILAEYQQAVSKQRASIETKQERIGQLETKVRDLSFEIRTLLQVDEMEMGPRRPRHHEVEEWVDQLPASSDPEVRTQYEASLLLKRSLQTAQSLTAAHYMPGRSGRFRDLSLDSLTIDLRRLFDRLRHETGGVVCVYSRPEHKLLFANERVRALFGWSPERFMKEFHSLLVNGVRDWEEAVHGLIPGHERQLRLVVRSKGGDETLVHALLGIVPQGAFEGHVLAVFYSAS